MTTNERDEELIKRAGVDPVTLDKRPLNEILNDEIPYERWKREERAAYGDPEED